MKFMEQGIISIISYEMTNHVRSSILSALTFTSLLANSADDKLTIVFLFFQENKFSCFMQIVSHILHEMSKPIFREK